jgi:hypothetical protein
MKRIGAIFLLALAVVPLACAQALTQEASKGFSLSDIQVLYGWNFRESDTQLRVHVVLQEVAGITSVLLRNRRSGTTTLVTASCRINH